MLTSLFIRFLSFFFLYLLQFGSTTFMYYSKTLGNHVSFICCQRLVSVKNKLLWCFMDTSYFIFQFACLVCQKTMALKNFSFRGNWVGSEVAGMKIVFFANFDPTWAHILDPKRPKYGTPRTDLKFSVPQKDRSYIFTLYVT